MSLHALAPPSPSSPNPPPHPPPTSSAALPLHLVPRIAFCGRRPQHPKRGKATAPTAAWRSKSSHGGSHTIAPPCSRSLRSPHPNRSSADTPTRLPRNPNLPFAARIRSPAHPIPLRRRPRRVDARPRHLLRRRRSTRCRRRRGLRVRRPPAERVRGGGGGGRERGAVPEGAGVRGVPAGEVRRRAPVLRGGDLRRAHRHQLLPAQLRPRPRRRRPLQPPQPPPRHAHPGLREDSPLERRQRPRPVPPDEVRQGRRRPVHGGRLRGVPQRAGEQRGGCGRRGGGEGEGVEDGVAADGAELGTELARQRRPEGAVPLLRGHHRRRRHPQILRRRPRRLVIPPDIRRQAVPDIIIWNKVWIFVLAKQKYESSISSVYAEDQCPNPL